MTQLQRIVIMDARFRSWAADSSRTSLDPLVRWYVSRVFINENRLIDFLPIGLRPPGGFPRPKGEFTMFTPVLASIQMDVGIYWGECLRLVEEAFAWKREPNRRNVAYNFPTMTGARLGYQEIPWQTLGRWTSDYFRGGGSPLSLKLADPLWYAKRCDDVLASPRIGEPGY